MGGNVFDWCWVWYSDTYYASSPETDPTGPAAPQTRTNRVVRGGSWANEAMSPSCAHRGDSTPVSVWSGFGFRCVMRAGDAEAMQP
ncbi:MAG: formylglycine-generating enzyme family protein [Kiritimatiellia bacterium]